MDFINTLIAVVQEDVVLRYILAFGAFSCVFHYVYPFSFNYARYSKGKEHYANKSDQKEEIQIFGTLYDIKKFRPDHPGGTVIESFIGGEMDCGDMFDYSHTNAKVTYEILRDLPSRPVPNYSPPEVIKYYRALKIRWRKAGLYDMDWPYELAYWAYFFVGMKIVHMLMHSGHIWIAALFAGHCTSRSNHVMHSLGHNTGYFTNRRIPRVLEKVIDYCPSPLIKFQTYYVVPLISQLTFMLTLEAPVHQIRHLRLLELAVTTLHYWCYDKFMPSDMSLFTKCFVYWVFKVSEGAWIAVPLSFNHYANPVLDNPQKMDFVTRQATCNTNYSTEGYSSKFCSFMLGHLNLHLEHHLAPDLPFWSLRAASKDVRVMCKKFDLPYNEVSFTKIWAMFFGNVYKASQAIPTQKKYNKFKNYFKEKNKI